MKIKSEIENIVLDFPRYGYRKSENRIAFAGDHEVNHKVVYDIMKKNGLLCSKKQFVPRTTDSEHNLPVYPNLTKDMFVTGINQYWAADITYIRLAREFIYLAAYNRCI